MVDKDLHVKPSFRDLLRRLSKPEYEHLKAGIKEANRVRDAILYWHHGGKNWIIDGHHRHEIATELGVGYHTEPMIFESEHEAKLWIINNQLGKRNLTPDEFTLFLGKLYNETKGDHGGDRKSGSKDQFDPLINAENTAETIGNAHGVSAPTVKRAGKTVELIESLVSPLQTQIKEQGKPSDALLKKLAKSDSTTQNAIAREMRTGETDWKKAAAKHGIKAPKKAKKKADKEPEDSCPNCLGTKWTDDEDGKFCAKCRHPFGEPAGDPDKKHIADQRSKTIKTAEALMRAFGDLNKLMPKPEYVEANASCKFLIKTAKEWK